MRTPNRLLICFALITALASLTHCSKDEVAPAAEAEKTGASAEAASKSKDAPKASKKVAAEPAKPVSKKPLMVTMPESVIAIVGVSSFNAGIKAAKRTLELMDPDTPQGGIVSTAKEGLKENFGWSDVGWLDMDKPIRMLMPDAKAHDGNNLVLILPTTERDKMLASLPEGSKTKEGPHAAVYEAGLTKLFVNFVDGHVVLTDDTRFFDLTKSFINEHILHWTPEQTLTVKASTKRMNALYATDISGMKSQLMMMLVAGAAAGGGGDMAAQVDLAFGLLTETDGLDLHLWMDKEDLKLRLDAFPKAGSFLASYGKLSGPKRTALGSQISPNAWFATIGNLDPQTIEQVMALSSEMMGSSSSGLSAEDQALLKGHYKKLASLSAGDSAVAGYIDGRFPFALSLVTKVTDSKAAMSAYEAIYQVMFRSLIKEIGNALGGETAPPQLKAITDTEQLVATINAMARPMGAKAAMFKEERAGIVVQGVRFGADWTQIGQATGLDKTDPEFFKAMSEVIGSRVEVAVAHNEQTVAMALGPNGADTATGLVGGKSLGGEAGINRVAADYNMIATMRAETMLKALSFMPDLGDQKLMAKVPANRPLQFATTGEEGWVRFDSVIPMDVLGILQKIVN